MCLNKRKNVTQCLSTNAYESLEINAHGIVQYIRHCRDNFVEFVIQNLNSQHCECFFRELRSMTSVNFTAVNFSMLEVEQRIQKVQMKVMIMHRNKQSLNFPNLRRREAKALTALHYEMPSDEIIQQAMLEAKLCAAQLLTRAGCKNVDFNFSSSVNERQTEEILPDVEFVAVEREGDGSCKIIFNTLSKISGYEK